MKPSSIHIALVDDHLLFRQGVASLLEEFKDISVDLQCANGKELQSKLPTYPGIEVVLMDIKMPALDGYATTAWVKKNYPHLQVLALSMFDEETEIISMLKAGASGYVLKESSPAELYKAIAEVKQNGFYCNDIVSGKLIYSFNRQRNQEDNTTDINLSKKELEFLKFCVSELTYKEIADQMNVATRTVDNYRESLFAKFDIKSRVGLALFAIRNKIADIG